MPYQSSALMAEFRENRRGCSFQGVWIVNTIGQTCRQPQSIWHEKGPVGQDSIRSLGTKPERQKAQQNKKGIQIQNGSRVEPKPSHPCTPYLLGSHVGKKAIVEEVEQSTGNTEKEISQCHTIGKSPPAVRSYRPLTNIHISLCVFYSDWRLGARVMNDFGHISPRLSLFHDSVHDVFRCTGIGSDVVCCCVGCGVPIGLVRLYSLDQVAKFLC